LGLFRVDGGPIVAPIPATEQVLAGSLSVPLAFNRRALVRDDVSNEQVSLASTRTKAGHPIGDLHVVILDELTRGGSDAIELRLADRLIAAGKHLREHATGRPIEDRAEIVHAAREICGGFFQTVLPELVRQGIAVLGPDQPVGRHTPNVLVTQV
jgi:hypothetical protein